jgi:anti-sigma factor RsiW
VGLFYDETSTESAAMHDAKVTYEQLIQFAAGDLRGDEEKRVAGFVQSSPQAAATVAAFRQVAEALRTDTSVVPPAETIARAKQLFAARTQPAAAPSWLERSQRLLASLVFDSRQQAALAGVRGPGAGFQLAFESSVADVDLSIEPSADDDWRLMGQVTPRTGGSAADVVVTLHGSLAPIRTVSTDEHGVFTLDMPPGRFDVFVAVQNTVVVLRNVDLE